MTKLTVPVKPELLRRFRLVTVQEGTTMSDVIRKLVLAYVESKESRSALHQAALEAGGVAAPVRPLIPASGPCQLIVPRGVKCKGCGKVH